MTWVGLSSALVSVITGMSEFSSADVTIGDERPVSKGRSNVVVIYPGPLSDNEVSHAIHTITWTTYIDLYVKKKQKSSADWISLATKRDALVAQLIKYPNLGQSTYFFTEHRIRTEGDVMGLYDKQDTGPFHLVQRLIIETDESVDVTGGDLE